MNTALLDNSLIESPAPLGGWDSTPAWLNRVMLEMFGGPPHNACRESALPLEANWIGPQFINIPTGEPIEVWAAKAADQAARGVEIVLLARCDTGTKGFARIWNQSDAVCFLRGRLRLGGKHRDAPYPSLLAYYGRRAQRFIQHCAALGVCLEIPIVTAAGRGGAPPPPPTRRRAINPLVALWRWIKPANPPRGK